MSTRAKYLFTSESVSGAHPDKLCDQVSDGVLDAILEQDPKARVACETATSTGFVLVFGELTTTAEVNIEQIARDVVRSVGYNNPAYGFDADSIEVEIKLDQQSPDIKAGVDDALETRGGGEQEIGAGDQGMMFGYAVDETPELMPLPISLAHKLCLKHSQIRRDPRFAYLRPDAKSQVTAQYSQEDRPTAVQTVVLSSQHDPDADPERMRQDLTENVIKPVLGTWWNNDVKVLINPSGKFVTGGPVGDAGLTGRKIIVDTYGGAGRHGGGAFSGKDPTKVDRSGAYAARYIAKNIVAAKLAAKVEVQLAYAIGVAEPVSFMVNSFGTGKIDDAKIAERVKESIRLTPGAIINQLGLRQPIYRQVAAYGHFGREDLDLAWERTDLADKIK